MNRQTLMRLQAEALFTHDPDGRLRHVNAPGGRTAPRFFLGRTPDGNEWRFRHNLDLASVVELEALCATLPPGIDAAEPSEVIQRFASVLNRQAPVERIWSGPAYHFSPVPEAMSPEAVHITPANADALRPYLSEWVEDAEAGQLVLAVLENGRAVSLCSSVRVTRNAHEAGVETAAEYRRRGYGRAAVSAWATFVADLGAIPLYSTSWGNLESRALATSLGLVQFGSNLHFE